MVVIDEAHGLREWAEMYATIDLSPQSIPMWNDIDVPDIDGLDEAVAFTERVEHLAERRVKELRNKSELTGEEVAERDSLNTLRQDLGGSARTTPTPRARPRGLSTRSTARTNR